MGVAVLAACLLSGCASSPIDRSGPSSPTSVRIERTYRLLNATPFQMTGNAADAAKLDAAIKALSPDDGQTACPGDVGIQYAITISSGTTVLDRATAIYGGCRVVLVGGKPYSGEGPAGKAFWTALFDIVGPAGRPDAGTGSSGAVS
jgi:hypothetical protein